MRLGRRGRDERADPPPGLEDAGAFELGVDAGHRVGVDAELDGELSDSRELVTRPKPAGGDRRAQPPLELGVDGGPVLEVEADNPHANYNTSSIVQVNYVMVVAIWDDHPEHVRRL